MLKKQSKNNLELLENESNQNIKHKRIVSIISFTVLILFSFAVALFIGRPMVNLVSEPQEFRNWVDSHGFGGRIIFIGMQILQVVIAIIPGEPLELGAGYAFGAFEGTVLCVIGNLLGGIIIFGIVRIWGIRFVELFFSREKLLSLKFLNNKDKLNNLIYILFLLPGTPKDLLSYFAGLTNISWSSWIMITSLARLPSIVTSTICGGALGKGNYKSAIIVFIISAILSIVGLIIYNIINKKHSQNKKSDTGEEINA